MSAAEEFVGLLGGIDPNGLPVIEQDGTEPTWWLRYRGGRVWHRAREVHHVGPGFVTMPTVCRFSGEAVAETKFALNPHPACKRCTAQTGGSS